MQQIPRDSKGDFLNFQHCAKVHVIACYSPLHLILTEKVMMSVEKGNVMMSEGCSDMSLARTISTTRPLRYSRLSFRAFLWAVGRAMLTAVILRMRLRSCAQKGRTFRRLGGASFDGRASRLSTCTHTDTGLQAIDSSSLGALSFEEFSKGLSQVCLCLRA